MTPTRLFPALPFFLLISAAASCAMANAGPPTYQLTTLGLTGPYYFPLLLENDLVQAVNDAGDVIGSTDRWLPSGDSLGRDAWLFDGATYHQLGLTGGIYTMSTSDGPYEFSNPQQLNDAGQAIGISSRNDFGVDAFFYNGVNNIEIGLTGGNDSYSITGGTYLNGAPVALNDSGQVIGITSRYDAVGNSLGQDAWYFNGAATQQIGYTGSSYGYDLNGSTYQYSNVTQINNAGSAIGYSNLYTGTTQTGSAAWLYDGTSLHPLGLTGTNYATGTPNASSTPLQINAVGQVIGSSSRIIPSYSPNAGSDAWFYDGAITHQLGLTGSIYTYGPGNLGQSSTAVQLTNSGNVIGFSNRYSSTGADLGADAWIFSGSTTQQIGLTGPLYTNATSDGNYQYSSPEAANEAGDVIGASNIYGAITGRTAWYFDGSTTHRLGLTGNLYNGNDGATEEHDDEALQLNASGDVIGVTAIFTNSGGVTAQVSVGGWFYDPHTDTTIPLDFSNNSDGVWDSAPNFVDNAGNVFGTYENYSNATDDGFVWNETTGFTDLGSLVDGGIAGAGWNTIGPYGNDFSSAQTPNGFPRYLIVAQGATQANPGSFKFGLLTADVPEPTGLIPVALCFLATIRLRARSSREQRNISM